MRNGSSTLRYGGAAYLADSSSTVEYVLYVDGGAEIARYLGRGDGAGEGENEHGYAGEGESIGEHVGGHVRSMWLRIQMRMLVRVRVVYTCTFVTVPRRATI